MRHQRLSVIALMGVCLVLSACAPTVEPTAAPTTPAPTTPTPPATTVLAPTAAPTSTDTPPPASAEPADLIFHNGNIITMEAGQPLAQAIAVREGLIQAVGTSEEILALQGPETKTIDLEGRTLMPGFVDPHTHILNDAEAYLGLNLHQAQDLALKNGITTLADMYVDQGILQGLRSLEAAGDLRVRTSAYLVATNNCGEPLGDWYTAYPPTDEFGEMLRIGGVKLFLDGGTCGPAAVSEVLKEGEGRGRLFLSDGQLAAIVRRADSAGYQIAIHALGDRAVDQAIDALNAVIDTPGNPERHRVEHALFMVDGQFGRFSEKGVNVAIFGKWGTCTEDGAGYTENWKHNIRRWRELVDANPGLVIAAKTDTPWGGPPNPLMELYSLTTLRDAAEDGSVCEPPPWLADRTLTTAEALPMLTINAAYLLFREDEVGSLRPGKLADLIVLSGDPLGDPDGIKDLSVLATLVGGQTAYCAARQGALCP
jgi:predicted amidohydrolase YtcJ